jgi:transcriptional regulator with XRE-family HTH domain
MKTILTAEQAKAARSTTRLSQGKVAADLEINRAYLSLFESGKYVFKDSVLTQLRSYYEEHGYDFGDAGAPEQTASRSQASHVEAVRIMDGFQVPSAMSEEEAEALLAEYSENSAMIQTSCAEKPEDFLFFGVDEDDLHERQYQVLMLMARNFTLIEQLHGRETVLPTLEAEKKKPKKTVGDYLSSDFADIFGFQDQAVTDDVDQDEAA